MHRAGGLSRRTRLAVLLAVATGAAVVGVTVFAGSATISTFGSWDGSNTISSFGKPDTATYGQTVVVPAGVAALSSFTFDVALPTNLVFRGEVYAWNGSRATGPALWEGAPMSTSTSGFQEITFRPDARVNPGSQLVLFASVSKDYGASGAGSGTWAFISSSPYPDGTFVYENNGNDPSQWTNTAWSNYGDNLAFKATFGDYVAPATRGGYCSVAGDTYPDGTPIPPGTFLNLPVTQASSDPHYTGVVSAAYFQGIGISCDNPPPGYTDSGTKVNSGGFVSADGLYEYWVKS
jgi:hypothetical protein